MLFGVSQGWVVGQGHFQTGRDAWPEVLGNCGEASVRKLIHALP